MTQHDVIIVGAGMAGISCARMLADAGQRVIVLDKGRGIGGRLATRRTPDGWQFDHGAQYVRAKSDGFADVLSGMRGANAADLWDNGTEDQWVGVPGMNALAKDLAQGLAVEQKAEVTALGQSTDGWEVQTPSAAYRAALVVLTVPAPQAAALLGDGHPLAARLRPVTMLPCLTLMAVFGAGPEPFVTRREPGDPLAWIALNSSKPGRAGPGCWVAQAGPAFSAAHIEKTFDEIAEMMLPMLCDRLGADPATVIHAGAHRWRYARVDEPLGAPFLADTSGTVFLGGDWCLGARVEAAWTSGTAIARRILEDG